MSFFESEVVRAEMTEIQELQEEVYSSVFKFPSMNTEEKKFHVSLLERLLEKQKVLYTRLSLSDDPEAKMMKTRIVESATMMGLPKDVDISVIFSNMGKMLDAMKKQIDIQGSDVQNNEVLKSQISQIQKCPFLISKSNPLLVL